MDNGIRKAVKKSVRGTLFRPWENPWDTGCGHKAVDQFHNKICILTPTLPFSSCQKSGKLQFIVLFSAAGAYLPPGGRWAAARRLGRGIREITLDTVQGQDLLKLYPFIGLIPLLCRRITARIPLPPPVAALPPAPSPRGKGLRPTAAVAPEGRQIRFPTER